MSRLASILACLLLTVVTATGLAETSSGEHVDDSLTTARVKMALLESSVSDASNINVETSKGVVQLSGFLSSKNSRSTAGKVAAEVEGVNDVSNRVTVRTGKRSIGRSLDDTILTSKVKLALAENKSTSATRINVEVREATVELSGFVDSYADRDTAIDFVSQIDGVKNIINAIDISK